MKKILCLLLIIATLCTALCGCTEKEEKPQESVDTYLQECRYQEAYEQAKSVEDKNRVIAENLIAYTCYQISVNASADWTLDSGYYGKAKAKETDAYRPNDETFAMRDYATLAEYVSLLSGYDVLETRNYAVLCLSHGTTKMYGLVSVEVETGVANLIYAWESLEKSSTDDNVVALYKYIAQVIRTSGTSLDADAIQRINDKYLTQLPQPIEFKLQVK